MSKTSKANIIKIVLFLRSLHNFNTSQRRMSYFVVKLRVVHMCKTVLQFYLLMSTWQLHYVYVNVLWLRLTRLFCDEIQNVINDFDFIRIKFPCTEHVFESLETSSLKTNKIYVHKIVSHVMFSINLSLIFYKDRQRRIKFDTLVRTSLVVHK